LFIHDFPFRFFLRLRENAKPSSVSASNTFIRGRGCDGGGFWAGVRLHAVRSIRAIIEGHIAQVTKDFLEKSCVPMKKNVA
jgi:hypothetical protein